MSQFVAPLSRIVNQFRYFPLIKRDSLSRLFVINSALTGANAGWCPSGTVVNSKCNMFHMIPSLCGTALDKPEVAPLLSNKRLSSDYVFHQKAP